MKPLTVHDLLSRDEYERGRNDYRRRIIELKENRRIAVGDLVTLVFENRDTILFQMQEMIRAEHIVAAGRIREEVETYNEQIPGPGELSATLFIEITESTSVKQTLDRFQGIDQGHTVGLQLGKEKVYGVFEQGRAKEDKISAVHYVRFCLPNSVQRQLGKLDVPMEITIHHPGYEAHAGVPDKMRMALLQDFD
jgi:hypothetical protein